MFSRTEQVAQLTDIRSRSLELALYTASPTALDVASETDFGAYARQPITFAAPVQVSDGVTMSNDTLITFPQATSDGTLPVSHWAVRTVGGSMVAHGTISELGVPSSRVVRSGDYFRVAVSKLMLKIKD